MLLFHKLTSISRGRSTIRHLWTSVVAVTALPHPAGYTSASDFWFQASLKSCFHSKYCQNTPQDNLNTLKQHQRKFTTKTFVINYSDVTLPLLTRLKVSRQWQINTSLVGRTTMQYGPCARCTFGIKEWRRSTTGMAYDSVFPVKKKHFFSFF